MEKIHKLCRSQKQTQSSSPPRNPLPLILFTTASTKKQGLLPHLFILVSLWHSLSPTDWSGSNVLPETLQISVPLSLLEPLCYLVNKPELSWWIMSNPWPANLVDSAYNQLATRHMIKTISQQASSLLTCQLTIDTWASLTKISPSYLLLVEPPSWPVDSWAIITSCCVKPLSICSNFYTQQ